MHTDFVRIITVMGVQSLHGVTEAVKRRYPDARLNLRPTSLGEKPSTLVIVIPDLLWNASPDGPETFFRGLCRSGLVNGFRHKRYSDQEEVRS